MAGRSQCLVAVSDITHMTSTTHSFLFDLLRPGICSREYHNNFTKTILCYGRIIKVYCSYFNYSSTGTYISQLAGKYRNKLTLQLTGQRSFAVNGLTVWNSLPPALRSPDLSQNTTFKRALKTHLFSSVQRHWVVFETLPLLINLPTYLFTYCLAQWRSETFGRPVRMSNLPPLRLWRYWRAYSTLLSTFSWVPQCNRFTCKKQTFISNSREADVYRYLDNSTISVRSGFWYAHTLQHAITTGGVSVRPSVCPVSSTQHIKTNDRRLMRCSPSPTTWTSSFFDTNFHTLDLREQYLAEVVVASNETAVSKSSKRGKFSINKSLYLGNDRR